MTLAEFTIYYAIDLVFFLWILRWGGAERLERSFLAGFLDYFAIGWNAEGIKLFALLWLIVSTLIFVLGLFNQNLRELVFLG